MVTAERLTGRRVLVVEDDWFIAGYVADALAAAGAVPIGPMATVDEALALLDDCRPDAATLNIDLDGGDSMPVARRLAAMGVPFVFLSGSTGKLPPDLAARPRLPKPFGGFQVVDAVAALVGAEVG